jgi:hypothetical protein
MTARVPSGAWTSTRFWVLGMPGMKTDSTAVHVPSAGGQAAM